MNKLNSVIPIVVGIAAITATAVQAQTSPIFVIKAEKHDLSIPLRDMPSTSLRMGLNQQIQTSLKIS